MKLYVRPLVQSGTARPANALMLAGGPLWFTHVELLSRIKPPRVITVEHLDASALDRLTAPRAALAGLDMARPHVMGIVNVTPDSFSDGGRHFTPETALAAALEMIGHGASILDIGGESTRPGATSVPADLEIKRTEPVIRLIRAETMIPISIDTRKSDVACAALQAGASLVNDVSGLAFDSALAPLCAARGVPVCLMHAQGDPATMQDNPTYDDVVLDVYDYLDQRISALTELGISRERIVVDPGIGFGKTMAHNLAILQNISLYHGLGCAILLGASRKRFIGTLGQAPDAGERAPGSIAVGLAALAQGVQILRVHDVAQTMQALRLWNAVR